MAAIIRFLSGLFGGGAWGIYLVLATVIGAFLLERGHMKGRIDELRTELQTVQAESLAKDETILSQARTSHRRSQANIDQQIIEEAINAYDTTTYCVDSSAIRTALDSLRDNRFD